MAQVVVSSMFVVTQNVEIVCARTWLCNLQEHARERFETILLAVLVR